jgi:hypothetical protein
VVVTVGLERVPPEGADDERVARGLAEMIRAEYVAVFRGPERVGIYRLDE